MDELEEMGLISKVSTELSNHWGVADKTLAEFVIHLAKDSDSVLDFQEGLAQNGAEVTASFAENLYGLIERMGSKKRKKADMSDKKSEASSEVPRSTTSTMSTRAPSVTSVEVKHNPKRETFPGLCVPDDRDREELVFDRPDEHAELSEHAQKLLENEKTDREKEAEAKRNPPKQEFKRGRKGPIELYTIHEGTVSRLMDYGAFITIDTQEGRKEGLVHISDVSRDGKLARIGDHLRRNQSVLVKIVGIARTKLSLSMREVDQETGADLKKRKTAAPTDDDDQSFSNPLAAPDEKGGFGQHTGITLEDPSKPEEDIRSHTKPRLSDVEKWESLKMKQSGVLQVDEYLDFDPEHGIVAETEAQEEFEVELVDAEPAFLKGQTTKTGAQLSPIKIVANPDGTLARAAATQSALAKERREVREQQEKSLLDSIPKDMSRPWEDPNPEPGERTIANALRGIGQTAYELPE